MAHPELMKQLLQEQERRTPNSDMVLRSIRTAITRRQNRRRRARMGAIGLGVSAAITVPVLAFGGHVAQQPSAGRPAPQYLTDTSVAPSPSRVSARSTTVGATATTSAEPSPGTAGSASAPADPAAPRTVYPSPRTSSTAVPTTGVRWTPPENLLDPKDLPPGLMPAGWIFYGAQGDVLVYGVTPTRDDAGAVAELRVGRWAGVGEQTCAGLPAKAVDDGRGTSYIAMQIDATRAYLLELGTPDFDRLTPAQAETVKSVGTDLCGDDMVWAPS